MSNLLSIPKVAAQLGVHHDTIRRAIKQGKLRAHKVGTTIRVLPESVDEYLKRNTVQVNRARSIENTNNETNETK